MTVILANELVKRGYRVTIVLTKQIIDYTIDDRVNILLLSPQKDYSHFNKIVQRCLMLYRKFLWSISTRKIISVVQPDVIVASWGSKVEAILRWHDNIPIISSEHNTFDREHTPKERYKRFVLNARFDKVVVLTHYDKEFTKNYLSNTLVIPNPLTYTPISIEEYQESFLKRRNILACGRVKAWSVKGFDNLIKAFSKVANKCKGWDLDIAGAGDEESFSYLKSLVSQYKIDDRVHFLGFCSNISEVMKSHSIFALTSRSEGFGMVLTEAMAMGCTCVSYSLTGPSEIINSEKDGLLVENQNVDKMAEALLRLINDPDLRFELGKKALSSVTRFSVDNITNKWEYLFKEVTQNE